MSINGTNNPFPCDPVIYTASNTIIAVGTITRNANVFTFSAGFKWRINGVVYENTAPINITVAVASSGKYRIDNALLNTSNSIELQQGLESDTIAIRPAYPENTILLTSWNVFGEIIDNNIDPIEGSDFVKKSFAYYFNANISGVEASIPFDAAGKTEIRLTNPDLESIASINITELNNVNTAERPYPGKPYLVRNLTGNAITILHDAELDGNIQGQRPRFYAFALKEAQDLTLPNNEAILFHFTDGKMVEIFRSWSEIDLSQKADLVAGKVPASQLPSYVDDVLEFANLAALPVVGEGSKIYVTLDTNKQYRWGGTGYVEFSGNTGSLKFNSTHLTVWNNGRNNLNGNTCFGEFALLMTTGNSNSAFGRASLSQNTSGHNNSSFGLSSLGNNSIGSFNSAFGSGALSGGSNGSNNVAFGYIAGKDSVTTNNITVNNSVFIGSETKANQSNETNQIVIGYQAIGAGSNTVTLGNTAITKTILRGTINVNNLTTFADNAAAVNGGLSVGDMYKTTTGEIRIRI